MPKEETLPSRKKMRKGTHSCRRRKIRCIYPHDNPDVCSECFARGSRCIDQEHADPEVVVDHRKNLRERVSRLEALVDSLLEEKTERSTSDSASISLKTPTTICKDAFPPTPLSSKASSAVLMNAQRAPSDRGHHVPILSVFEAALNDAEERIKARLEPHRKGSSPIPNTIEQDRYTISYKNAPDVMEDTSQAQSAKKERAKQALLSMLPPQPQLNKVLNTNSEWWLTWRHKCSGTCTRQDETLAQFAAKALSDSNIGAMGTVLLAVGICTDDEREVERCIEAIDQWVLADDEYAATLEGMEILILKGKWYADVGQPRRSWLALRKGLMYTQLMGLHRKRTNSAAHESIWWSLYHGDRFLSLLLGLPYGINDAHCDLTLPEIPTNSPYLPPLMFMNRVCMLAGKVIDRNQGMVEQSFAWALQIDQELEDLWKQLDPNWLEYSELLLDIQGNAAELRERIMAQITYHQIRVHLHLPFMLKSQTNSRFTYSRTACLAGSREVLRLYQSLRTGTVQPLYECKAIDFIGFTSAVLIMLGIFNYGAPSAISASTASLKDKETDIRLIEISIDIFRRASSEKGGKVAMQSGDVLEKMLMKYRHENIGQVGGGADDPSCGAPGNGPEMIEFVIPYFGTISIRRGGKVIGPDGLPENVAARKVASRSASSLNNHNHHNNNNNPQQLTPSSTSTTASTMNFFSQNPSTPNPGLTTTPSSKTNQTSTTSPSHAQNQQGFGFQDPFVSYEGFYNWGNALDAPTTTSTGTATGTQINDDSLSNFPLPTNNFSWQNMPMDIDQDWSWFLNDGGMGDAGGMGGGDGAGNGQAVVGDLFQQKGFAGFG
ncbi:hypothetical protein P280DRAFT_538063 [Massarina eburnea CBS 473.64]|uniref:Xylanolytic transcriptional activator regulatory domain-containing protein n=1 Tax=Massarina eburnea CBS 473.64 TaxID=1395130 RepID=A0A6A6S9H4_9PLEO|nr:hypothetical protein P280DRAFT_538063 [Massarina eburnea CBS 473.64]